MSPTRRTSSVRYAFDEANRLITGDPSDPLRSARVFEGRVTTDRQNRLLYYVKAGTDGRGAPHTFNLDGTWKLTPNHDLALALHEAAGQKPQTLFLRGAIVEAQAHALVFALRRSEDDDLQTAQRITLSGGWRADERNRLTFLVEKADGSQDRLTLQGGWEVGRHHELLYRYRQRAGKRRVREEQTLAFEGAWDLTKVDRLVYRMAGSPDSSFEFKAGLQSPSLMAREGRVVYQVGIGISGRGTTTRRVILFGVWKLHRDLSVSFEIPYGEGRHEAIRFEGTVALSKRNELAVQLLNRRGRPLGLTVVFTRRFLDDASLFVRLRKDGKALEALAGVQVKF